MILRALVILLLFCCALAQAAPAPQTIHVFDMTGLFTLDRRDPVQAREAWDTAHLVASLQGIVNRDQPRLFVRFMKETDDFWLAYLRERGNWLADTRVIHVASLNELLDAFIDSLKGVILYDERVPATSNLASSIAGVEDRLCLRFDSSPDSLCQQILRRYPKLQVIRLVKPDGSPMFTGAGKIPGTDIPSTGSAKCDAYLWAAYHYLDRGRCGDEFLAYYIDAYWLSHPTESSLDNNTLTNHDFFISHRAFFFDLGMWEEESPVDDRGQKPGTDVRVLRSILTSMYKRSGGKILQIGGFVPWAWKYTNHGRAGGRHGGVDSEWKYAQIISSYNGIMDADAIGISGMANASFCQHFPLKDRYPQNPRPTIEQLKTRGLMRADGSIPPNLYIMFYMGDYDSAAWLNVHVPRFWKDPARGQIPCAWAFNPNLDRRAPHALHYARTHASANDWFISGDSGAGYLNPGMLLNPNRPEGIPEGMDAWLAHNLRYYQRYDLSITGFIIDGHSPQMGPRGLDAYVKFSPDGMIGQHYPRPALHRDTMPYLHMQMDLEGSPPEAAKHITALSDGNLPRFAAIRTILKSPSWHKQVMDQARSSPAGQRIRFVDPYSFFLLLKAHLQRQG